ncbi:MAG: PTS sugar transporter subunit IIA [Elusimicrobiota bacterium]|nr:PTS sugar transporter subunit IIA [Elusimicrobiota bacterium]MDH5661894.1 PTS sugar transporter subunit IIA [Elusimicrobiota bacterium]
MIGFIIVTHGDFGRQLVKAAEIILGEQKEVWAISLHENDGLATLSEKIEKILKKGNKRSEGKIILVDIFGGTAANASLRFVNDEKVEIISGVNLPMLIAGMNYRQSLPVKELAERIRQNGKESILDVKQRFLSKISKAKNK